MRVPVVDRLPVEAVSRAAMGMTDGSLLTGVTGWEIDRLFVKTQLHESRKSRTKKRNDWM